ncbi:hypothetical protein [Gemmobacter sp. 24YEA27]|uniref:hypothetical protein n=1 Tax=Gemmobacter sp. 24YEA27 TaxID=3040672 RepID=UPI0024B3B48D|nr:hypothetical protein [Gemmobacter sp. 24YEA27]
MQWANLLSEDNRSDLAQDLSNWGSYFGQLHGLTGSSLDGLLKLQQGFSAATALINAWEGYTTVLRDPTVPYWGKMLAAGKVLAAGLGAVSAIKGAGKGGARTSAGGSSGSTTAAATQDSNPVAVTIQGLDPDSLYSGKQVIGMTDAVQKELKRRGVVLTYTS